MMAIISLADFRMRKMKKADEVVDSIKDFKKSLEGLKASTLRVYLAGARTAINAVKADVSQCRSHGELLALIQEAQPEKGARIAPFLRFLERNSGGRQEQLRATGGSARDPILPPKLAAKLPQNRGRHGDSLGQPGRGAGFQAGLTLLALLERTAGQARSEATLSQSTSVEPLKAPFSRTAR